LLDKQMTTKMSGAFTILYSIKGSMQQSAYVKEDKQGPPSA